MTMGLRDRDALQERVSLNRRPPTSHSESNTVTVRNGPIFAALTVLFIIPLCILNYLPTSFGGHDSNIHGVSSTTTVSNMRPQSNPNSTQLQRLETTLTDAETATLYGFTSKEAKKSSALPGVYTGKPWISPLTVDKKIISETPFARCELHTVRSEDGKTKFDNWLFMEERDAINVAVVNTDGNFVLFRQHKYAIPGATLSPVGGFIDDGETPYEAAKREVKEELGMASVHQLNQRRSSSSSQQNTHIKNQAVRGSTTTTATSSTTQGWNAADGRISDSDPDWIYLGMYRTSSNRGGGFMYTYLLKNAIAVVPGGGTTDFKEAVGDDEAQIILHMTQEEVLNAVSSSQFKEVKWAATMSLSLLHIRDGMPGNT